MENLIPKIEKTLQAELSNFLSLGAILTKVEQETPWHEAGMTKGQWLAGEAGLPIITANQAKDAYLLLRDIDSSLVKKLTVVKLKLILPQLKRADGQDEEEKELKDLVVLAGNMLYNDLRDALEEKNSEEECEPSEWEHKEYWRCPKNGQRIYTDPTKKD